MREFKLTNGKGVDFDLMRLDAFFSNPGGLGIKRNVETLRFGKNFITVENSAALSTITGTMNFRGYEQYSEFVDFIQFDPVSLSYKPLNDWWTCIVEISSLTKTEKNLDDGKLVCSIDFIKKSQYFKNIVFSPVLSENGKRFPFSYSYTYENTTSTFNIQGSSYDNSLKISLYGPTTNPEYSLYDMQNQLIGKGKFALDVPENQIFVINSNPFDLGACLCDLSGNVLSDKMATSDFSTERFLYPPKGMSTLVFLQTNHIKLEVLSSADSV